SSVCGRLGDHRPSQRRTALPAALEHAVSLLRGTMPSRAPRRWVRGWLVLVTLSLVVAGWPGSTDAGAAPFSVPAPVSGGWQLNGTAVLNTAASPANLQLTAATGQQAGSAFYPTAVPGVGISAAFDAYIGSGSGGDGLTFTLANASVTRPTALGVNGGGLGFSGIAAIAVALDTH